MQPPDGVTKIYDDPDFWWMENPYNWCDGQCERCARRSDCKLAADMAERREDPDDPEGIGWVREQLERALGMMEEALVKAGLDPDNLEEDQTEVSAYAQHLRRTSLELVCMLDELVESCERRPEPPSADTLERLGRAASLLPAKLARITPYLAADGEVTDERWWINDGIPTTLLLERLHLELFACVAEIQGDEPDPGRREREERLFELRVAMSRLSAAVPAAHREALDLLIAAGRAPSPFVKRRGASPSN